MDKELKSRLRVDYELLQSNRFWVFYAEEITKIRQELSKMLETAPTFDSILQGQGMLKGIDRIIRLPEKLADEIGR